ncbi:hypothetical protein [Abyssogena phaseoliformis symbiont]|nr:hypothetical protein [Abyssogena phaseoliformis symbiont]
MPLTKNHEWRSEAQGWFSNFELRDDGIYATLELNDAGEGFNQAQSF